MTFEQIGRYEILQALGEGSMATVYLGRDPYISRMVAIKVMSPELTDPSFEERFRYEAELIANLDHPYIVPVYDFGYEQEHMYIVMHYMAGGTLTHKLQPDGLPPAEILPIVTRLADVLDTIHARGIIHRDLKPGNILFNGRDEAYLGDFGIAKNLRTAQGFTATDVVLGTVYYMSPEQIQGAKDLDGRTDVYALGILLYYLLTGKLPYQHKSLVNTAMAHMNAPIPPVATALDQAAAWNAIFARALAKKRADRFATAGELATAVHQLHTTHL